jgi:hypothetical protein
MNIGEQMNEDTCEEHDVFCCPVCFDQTPVAWVDIRARIDSEEPAPEATSDCPSEEEHLAALLLFGTCPWCGQTA